MTKALCIPYKQVMAWYSTGKGMKKSKLWSVTETVISELYKKLLTVRVVTSDMGAANVGKWNAVGVDINTHSNQC
jgi:hypothetical protein